MAALSALLLAVALAQAPAPAADEAAPAEVAPAEALPPRFTLELNLGPLLLQSSLSVLFELRVTRVLSLFLRPEVYLETIDGTWRRWTGTGATLGLRVFPLGEAPRGWHLDGILEVYVRDEAAFNGLGAGTAGAYGVHLNAGLATGYRWILWGRLSLTPYLGVRYRLVDLFPPPATPGGDAQQSSRWGGLLGLNVGVAF